MSGAFQVAAKAALEAAGVDRVYDENAVPTSPPYPHLVLAVTPDRADAYTLDASHGTRLYRIVTRTVSRSIAAAQDVDQIASDALLDKRLTVVGYDCSPCRIELGSAMVRDPDDNGVLVITTTLTFTATKEL